MLFAAAILLVALSGCSEHAGPGTLHPVDMLHATDLAVPVKLHLPGIHKEDLRQRSPLASRVYHPGMATASAVTGGVRVEVLDASVRQSPTDTKTAFRLLVENETSGDIVVDYTAPALRYGAAVVPCSHLEIGREDGAGASLRLDHRPTEQMTFTVYAPGRPPQTHRTDPKAVDGFQPEWLAHFTLAPRDHVVVSVAFDAAPPQDAVLAIPIRANQPERTGIAFPFRVRPESVSTSGP